MRQAVGTIRCQVDVEDEIVAGRMHAFDRDSDASELIRDLIGREIDIDQVF
jgi:hypothetical protein